MSSPRTGLTSVVIPAHNAAATLRACLDALLPLIESGEIREVLIVDDHSSDSTRSIAARYPLEVLRSARRGAGAARNVGWRAARGDQIWFVDADCIVHADALALLRAAMAELQADAVGGSYSNHNAASLIADLIHAEMITRHRTMGRTVTFAITANLLCRRSALETLGGFDESLRLGQDLDFAYRLVDSGRRLGFEAKSQVAHFHETRSLKYLRKQARQGFWRMHIYRRHPARISGDTYSGAIDYVQPPLAALGALAPLAGWALGIALPGLWIAASAGAALLLCQVPMACKLVRASGRLRYWYYIPFGATRAAFRGAGMIIGLVSVAFDDLLAMPREVVTRGAPAERRGPHREVTFVAKR